MSDEQRANATINKWQRYKDEDEKKHRDGVEGLKKFMEEAIKNEKIRRSVDSELREVRKTNKSRYNEDRAGFNLVDDDYDPLVDGDGGFQD